MGRKKTNPHKVPLAQKTFDAEKMVIDITNKNVSKGWALFLGALAHFRWTTSESMKRLWDDVYTYTVPNSNNSIAKSLKYLEKITGIPTPYQEISTENIRTQGDLDKFIKRANQNALYTFFSIIAEPIVNKKLLKEEDIPLVFRKAYALEDEITQGYITIQDLLDMLEDEYAICLKEVNGQVELQYLEE